MVAFLGLDPGIRRPGLRDYSPAIAVPAHAGFITDPANDFIPTFGGTHNGSLDVLSVSATFDGTNFHISATENGTIAAFPTGHFVIGFNRGAETSNFAAIGLPGVVFDAVIILTSAGVPGGRDLVSNTAIVLPASDATISGSTFQISIPLSALPDLLRARAADFANVGAWSEPLFYSVDVTTYYSTWAIAHGLIGVGCGSA